MLAAASVLIALAIVAGLAYRKSTRLSHAWLGYLLVVAISEALIGGWPYVFWNWDFWVGKELLIGVVTLLLGLELGTQVFRRFPGARQVARGLAAVLLSLTALLLIRGSGTAVDTLPALALEAHARLSHATALLLISLGLLVLWYRVPVHRLHRVILRGLATYLLVFSSALRGFVEMLAPERRALWGVLTRLDGIAYVVMLAYWLWEVWRRVPDDDVRGSAAIEARLAWRERLGGEKQEARP